MKRSHFYIQRFQTFIKVSNVSETVRFQKQNRERFQKQRKVSKAEKGFKNRKRFQKQRKVSKTEKGFKTRERFQKPEKGFKNK